MQMKVLDASGHKTLTCDTGSETDIPESEVKAEFDRLIAANFAAFDVGVKSDESNRVKEWNPNIENLTVIPPMAGGC